MAIVGKEVPVVNTSDTILVGQHCGIGSWDIVLGVLFISLAHVRIVDFEGLFELIHSEGETICFWINLLADDIGIIDHGILLEESSMDELQRKNSKYILLQVSEVSKALQILERQFGVKDYSVQDEQTLRLYDTTLDMAAINKALVTQEVSVISSGLCNDTLEDYFKKITGGEGIA